jgi:hypothetical protein
MCHQEIVDFLNSQDPGKREVVYVPMSWVPEVRLSYGGRVYLDGFWHPPTGRTVYAGISEYKNTIYVTQNVKELWAGKRTRVLPPSANCRCATTL